MFTRQILPALFNYLFSINAKRFAEIPSPSFLDEIGRNNKSSVNFIYPNIMAGIKRKCLIRSAGA